MRLSFLKTFAFFGLLAFLGMPCIAHAQARPSPATQVISVDFVPIIVHSGLALQYEIKADPTDSWLARLYYWPSPSSDGTWSGFGVGGAYRIYIADSRALTGLSVAPVVDFFFSSQAAQIGGTGSRTAIAIDIGGDLAYKWIFDQFAVEPIFGIRIGFSPSAVVPDRATGLQPIIGCGVGYAW